MDVRLEYVSDVVFYLVCVIVSLDLLL